MGGDWYLRIMGEVMGPLSDQELRTLANSRRVGPETPIRSGTSGNWVPAERIRGLFEALVVSSAVQQTLDLDPSGDSVDRVSPRMCPFCAEEIADAAIKCRHCDEFLYPVHRDQAIRERPGWDPNVAGILSFFVPGAGQIYKGQIANGLTWLVSVALGYAILIIPGLVLHVCCIVGARSQDPSSEIGSQMTPFQRYRLIAACVILFLLIAIARSRGRPNDNKPSLKPTTDANFSEFPVPEGT